MFLSCSHNTGSYKGNTVEIDEANNDIRIDAISLNEPIVPVSKEESLRKVYLILVPALYSSVSYLGVMDQITQNEIKIKKIYTSGFSALLVAVFAKYKKLSLAEWSLFKLVRDLKNKEPYSNAWKSTLSDFIDQEFSDLDFESLDINIWGESRSQRDIKLTEFLKKEIEIDNIARIHKHIDELIISSGGLDPERTFTLSALPRKLELKFNNDYLFGNYAKMFSFHKNENLININNDYKIDNSEAILKMLNLGKEKDISVIKRHFFEVID